MSAFFPHPAQLDTQPVRALAFSPDGQTLALGTASSSEGQVKGQVKLCDVATGAELPTLENNQRPFQAVAFSLDGKLLAAGTADGSARVWDLETRKVKLQVQGFNGATHGLAFSPDSTMLATTSGGNDMRSITQVKLWDVVSGQLRHTLEGHTKPVWAVSFAPDGKTLATGSLDGTIRLWNPQDGAERGWLKAHRASIFAVAFAPSTAAEPMLASASFAEVKLWSPNTNQGPQLLKAHGNQVGFVRVTRDGKSLVTTGMDLVFGRVKVWDPRHQQGTTTQLQSFRPGVQDRCHAG